VEQVELRETYRPSPAIVRYVIAFIMMLINKVYKKHYAFVLLRTCLPSHLFTVMKN